MQLLSTIKFSSKKASLYSVSAILALAAVITVIQPGQANAGTLSSAFVRFDRLQTSAQSSGTVCAKPSAAGPVEASVQVTFPTGYTLGLAATFTVNTTNTGWPTGAQAWTGIGNASNVTGQVVTFPSGDLSSASTVYCFNWANPLAVQIKSSATTNTGTIATRDSVPATIDSASYTTISMAADSIGVSAQVPQSFNFTLSGTTDNLGSLTSGSVSTSASGSTVGITTNAATGWMVWAKDANAGLLSPSTGSLIASTNPGGANSTLSFGTEGYNMGVTSTLNSGTGTISIAAPFAGGSTGKGGGLDTTMRTITSATGIANATLTLKNSVAISNNTPAAADYADTITVVGAGMF